MSTPSSLPHEITQLLAEWSEGNQAALDKLYPLVYNELRRLAHGYLRRERKGHTLQTTALINEAYLRLVDQKRVHWANRSHFFAISAQIMRRILIDHARRYDSAKRGGGAPRLSLDDAAEGATLAVACNRRSPWHAQSVPLTSRTSAALTSRCVAKLSG